MQIAPSALRRPLHSLRVELAGRLSMARSSQHSHYRNYTPSDWRRLYSDEPGLAWGIAYTLPRLLALRCCRLLGIRDRAAEAAPNLVPAGLEGLAAALGKLPFPELHTLSTVVQQTPLALRWLMRYVLVAAIWERDRRMGGRYILAVPPDGIAADDIAASLHALDSWGAELAADDRTAAIAVLNALTALIPAGAAKTN